MNYSNNKRDIFKAASSIVWLVLGSLFVLATDALGIERYNSQLESSCTQDTIVVDFDQGEFIAGDIVSGISYPGGTISVFGFNPDFPGQNAAMIFDTNNPTGGDLDLGTPNEFFGGPGINFDGTPVPSNDVPLNNVLIISEDLNSNEPDDAKAEDISMSLEFSSIITLVSIDLLDLDSGNATIILFDSAGNEIFSIEVPETGCNGLIRIELNVPNVARMSVNLNGSGAIDNITFLDENGSDGSGNGAPSANDDTFNTPMDSTLTVDPPGVLANDTDPNGDTLTIIGYDSTSTLGGKIELSPDGGFTYTPPIDIDNTDSINTDTFTYLVTDGNGCTDTGTVSINIFDSASENSPPNAVDDEYMTDQDIELVVSDSSEGILANDSDPDGDHITALEVNDGITDQGGRISIKEDGTFSYTPNLGYIGVDTYLYTVCDDQDPQLCSQAIIYIEVKELPVKVFNAFSPNDDERNDTWIIPGITKFPNNEVQIFNRWGNLIFQVVGYDNTTKVWRGESTKGIVFGKNEVPDGAYFYVITLGDGSKRLSGYVVIQR